MKAVLLFVIGTGMYLSTLSTIVNSSSIPEKPMPAENSWVKSNKGMWHGGYTLWYKMDKKNTAVQFSSNKRKWAQKEGAAWQDNEGRWLYIYQGKLLRNSDGKNWVEVTDRTWQDLDGNWYKFDDQWNLMEAPDGID